MKIAHLILAHGQPEQLRRLMQRLAHPDAWFFVHLDAKTDAAPFAFVAQQPNAFLIADRVKVSWGAYSIVQATINGFKAITSSQIGFDFVNLISGSDYPIKSTEQFHTFLQLNAGKNFLEYQMVNSEWTEAITRLTEYHFTNYKFPGQYVVQRWVNKLLPKRKMPDNLVPVGRSQWMTLSIEAVQYLLAYLGSHPEVERFFKLTWAPDEIVFQTILYNSDLQSTLVNNNLRYIDWTAGQASPKTLTAGDLNALLASDAFFARKFDMKKDPSVLDLIDKNL